MKTMVREVALDLLLWLLRGSFPAAILGLVWWKTRGMADAATARAYIPALCTFVVMLWMEMESLKSKLRALEAPGLAAEQWRQRARERRKAVR